MNIKTSAKVVSGCPTPVISYTNRDKNRAPLISYLPWIVDLIVTFGNNKFYRQGLRIFTGTKNLGEQSDVKTINGKVGLYRK